ncbi:DUF5710 domain-containing protein [Sulfobacillus harzensis]|uniref:DNA primase n=1 Tax=Sulfobacillus harzensis TaxID=2729629 RepID=A0A7Y0L661_9FIRM|nr:DUF5710 domain-containing protein [Sulfobacillus harzensis]NMP22644.1 DNA primase [Sulfobacillus harzensis]
MPKLYLAVPYADRERAKTLGARWDPVVKSWYVSDPQSPALQIWAAETPLPNPLPGEDRSFGSGLFVDLIPESCWFTNVRSAVDPRDWDRVRRYVYHRAGYRCEACGTRGSLHAHERWDYDSGRRVQTLKRLVALCPDCHLSTHFGYANVTGRTDQALHHLMAVNHWSETEARHHIQQAFNVWQERNRWNWILDLGILEKSGIRIVNPVNSDNRRQIAQNQLQRDKTSDSRPG